MLAFDGFTLRRVVLILTEEFLELFAVLLLFLPVDLRQSVVQQLRSLHSLCCSLCRDRCPVGRRHLGSRCLQLIVKRESLLLLLFDALLLLPKIQLGLGSLLVVAIFHQLDNLLLDPLAGGKFHVRQLFERLRFRFVRISGLSRLLFPAGDSFQLVLVNLDFRQCSIVVGLVSKILQRFSLGCNRILEVLNRTLNDIGQAG